MLAERLRLLSDSRKARPDRAASRRTRASRHVRMRPSVRDAVSPPRPAVSGGRRRGGRQLEPAACPQSSVSAPSSPIEIGMPLVVCDATVTRSSAELELNQLPTVKDGEGESSQLRRQLGVRATARPRATRVRCSSAAAGRRCRPSRRGGCPRGRAALDVGDVALQRLHEELPCLLRVGARQHPGADHPAQSRAVRGARQVVGDGPGGMVGCHWVAECSKQLAQLVGRRAGRTASARRPAWTACSGSGCRPRPPGSGPGAGCCRSAAGSRPSRTRAGRS